MSKLREVFENRPPSLKDKLYELEAEAENEVAEVIGKDKKQKGRKPRSKK